LKKRLAQVQAERQRALKIPEVTEPMVDDVEASINRIFSATVPKELQRAIGDYIERIEIKDREMTIRYSFAPDQTISYCKRPRGDLNPRSPP
jgi:hypothetical protein